MKIRKIDPTSNEMACPKCAAILVFEVGDIFDSRIQDQDETLDCYAARCASCKTTILVTNELLIKKFYSPAREDTKTEILKNLNSAISQFDRGNLTATRMLCQSVIQSIDELKSK